MTLKATDVHSNVLIDNALDTALALFMDESHASLFAFLRQLLPHYECEDIAQEAYLKLYLLLKEKPNLHEPLALLRSLRPMLTVIAKNLALSLLRHNKVVDTFAESSSSNAQQDLIQQNRHSVEHLLISQDDKRQLVKAINKLPPICRNVFIQQKLNGKSYKEIAKIMNISTKTVENHLAKGLLLCRRYMHEQASQQYNRASQTPAKTQDAS